MTDADDPGSTDRGSTDDTETPTDPTTRSTGTSEGTSALSTGSNYKVRGKLTAPDGIGVLGRNDAVSGTPKGVVGETTAASVTGYGVQGTTAGDQGAGVYGHGNSDGFGVDGVHGVTEGTGLSTFGNRSPVAGVVGRATTSTGIANGVFGITEAPVDGNAGVEGTTSTSGGRIYGVRGRTGSSTTGAAGVLGEGAGSGQTYGVEGRTDSPDGYGLYTPDDARLDGDLEATSGLTVTVGGARALHLGPPSGDAGNVVAGHPNNRADTGVKGATISGGGSSFGDVHSVTDDFGTLGGGSNNRAGDSRSGTTNATFATVAGGQYNTASGEESTVGGGRDNTAGGDEATVAGGSANTARGSGAAVGGGAGNDAFGHDSAIGGGDNNRTGKSGSTVGGSATVPGGSNNVAEETFTFAAGNQAKARDEGAFVWADSTFVDFASDQSGTSGSPTGADTFHAQATGGVRFVTGLDGNDDPNAGSYLASGGSSWQMVSAESVKHDVRPVDPRSVLAGVESLSIGRWAYDARPGVDRMGPMAGEFFETFGLGDDPDTIGHVDADGVALAAIQGLAERLADARDDLGSTREELDDVREELDGKDERIDAQQEAIEALRAEKTALRERLAAVEDRLTRVESPGTARGREDRSTGE